MKTLLEASMWRWVPNLEGALVWRSWLGRCATMDTHAEMGVNTEADIRATLKEDYYPSSMRDFADGGEILWRIAFEARLSVKLATNNQSLKYTTRKKWTVLILLHNKIMCDSKFLDRVVVMFFSLRNRFCEDSVKSWSQTQRMIFLRSPPTQKGCNAFGNPTPRHFQIHRSEPRSPAER